MEAFLVAASFFVESKYNFLSKDTILLRNEMQLSSSQEATLKDDDGSVYNFSNFEVDPSVIRGLEYYTGPIFEVNLRFDVKNNKGQVVQFGSIGGGGRYDNLVSNFGNYDAPATGISIGLDRLVYALMQKKEFKIKQTKPIVICIFEKSSMINMLAYKQF